MAKFSNIIVVTVAGILFLIAAAGIIKSEPFFGANPLENEIEERYIINQWLYNTDKVQTATYDLRVKASLTGGILSALKFSDMQITNMSCEIDNKNMRLHTVLRMNKLIKIQPEAYIMANQSFISLSGQGWIRSERRFGVWGTKINETEFLNKTEIKVEGTQTIDGTDCYVIKIRAEGPAASQLLAKELGANTYSENTLLKNLANLSSTEYINKETFLPTKIESEITFKSENETEGLRIKTEINSIEYNKQVEIKLPSSTEYYIEERYMIGVDDMFQNLPFI